MKLLAIMLLIACTTHSVYISLKAIKDRPDIQQAMTEIEHAIKEYSQKYLSASIRSALAKTDTVTFGIAILKYYETDKNNPVIVELASYRTWQLRLDPLYLQAIEQEVVYKELMRFLTNRHAYPRSSE